jgi:hypothetical protein
MSIQSHIKEKSPFGNKMLREQGMPHKPCQADKIEDQHHSDCECADNKYTNQTESYHHCWK